ncbi:endonuclease [Mycobacterium sp. ACS1612]|uniref:endonuclease n=1 Tax=Mycobacterium sp. ACS1612 TaxID=1834117 RepID=UPI0007FD256B|nr:endonuclease [Mycobacterium sp. ACS1612]OBF35818.1 endonuclease [Mycobacterium sp. ACS1612]
MDSKQVVRSLLEQAGTTYAAEAGIRLKDQPMPLFQLLTLSMLASKPIEASIAVQAARELFRAGLRTPDAVLEADRRDIIRTFGRAHYVRYDESSATRLADIATAVRDDYGGDLRKLATGEVPGTVRLLKRFKGIGDTGADIFLREAQQVWPWARPYFDKRAVAAARQLGLPADPEKLGALAGAKTAELAAALVRVSLDDDLRVEVQQGT